MQLLTHETPDFIVPTFWPVNSPDLNPITYQISRSVCPLSCSAAGCMMSPSWSRTWSKSGNISIRWSIDYQRSSQAVAFTSSSLHSSTWRIFWTQTFALSQSHVWTWTIVDISYFWVTSSNFLQLLQILLKVGDLFAIKWYTVDPEFG